MENFKKGAKFALLGALAFMILVIVFSSFTTIPTGFVGVKTRFGKAQEGTIQEGLNFRVPLI